MVLIDNILVDTINSDKNILSLFNRFHSLFSILSIFDSKYSLYEYYHKYKDSYQNLYNYLDDLIKGKVFYNASTNDCTEIITEGSCKVESIGIYGSLIIINFNSEILAEEFYKYLNYGKDMIT